MTDKDINGVIKYNEVVGSWLCLRMLVIIAKCKLPVDIKDLANEISGTLFPLEHYGEKIDTLKKHGLINDHNMITLKGRRFIKHLEKLIVLE